MSLDYAWISNQAKAIRAQKELIKQNQLLKAQGKPEVAITEEAIKALYLQYGGLAVGEPETQRGVPEGVVMPPVVPADEEEVEVKPKSKRK